jgi:hypothetical protein
LGPTMMRSDLLLDMMFTPGFHEPLSLSLPGLTGQSSNPRAVDAAEALPHGESGGYWIARSSWAMTIEML